MATQETVTLPAPQIMVPPTTENKWQREFEAFQRLRPDLLRTHLGQYVVIHNGKVVDAGLDDLALALRFFDQHGKVSVHNWTGDCGTGNAGADSPLSSNSGERNSVIRYSYNTQVQPPAPFVFLTLRNPADGSELQKVPAQIDLGADQTVLPDAVVHTLDLPQMGTMVVGGLGGVTYTLPKYAVLLSIHDLPLQPVKVIGAANEPWVLLGRDIVNAHRIVLDGPQLALEIG